MSTSNLLPRWYRPRAGLGLGRWLGMGATGLAVMGFLCVWAGLDGPESVRADQIGGNEVCAVMEGGGADNEAAEGGFGGKEPDGAAVSAEEAAEAVGGVQMGNREVDSEK